MKNILSRFLNDSSGFGKANRWIPIEFVVSAAILLLPVLFASNKYFVTILQYSAIFAILAMALNLVSGYTGQISLGQAAFYALGAYAAVILEVHYQVPLYIAWPAAIVITSIIAWLIAFPVLKLSGHYLALATIAFGLIIVTLISQGGSFTGGHDGLILPALTYLGATLRDIFPLVIIASAVLIYWLLRNLTESSVGRSLRAVRDDPDAAAALGIPVSRYRTLSFVLAAAFSALAGIFYAHLTQVITPDAFGFNVSIDILLMVIVGGMGHRFGGVIGAVVVMVLPELLADFGSLKYLIVDTLVLLALIFLPKGVVSIPHIIRSLFKPWGKKPFSEEIA